MTVIFHNSSAKVWEALQCAISCAGFTIEASQIFDKEHGTFKQFVSENAVGYDLVLHCRKSSARLAGREAEQNIPADNAREKMRQDAVHFIRQAIKASSQAYIVRYLHVAREDELDYRRLYSEWLARTLPQKVVGLGFEEFRLLVNSVITAVTSEVTTIFLNSLLQANQE